MQSKRSYKVCKERVCSHNNSHGDNKHICPFCERQGKSQTIQRSIFSTDLRTGKHAKCTVLQLPEQVATNTPTVFGSNTPIDDCNREMPDYNIKHGSNGH